MYPEHLKAFDYLGLRQYFLTFCTHNRGRLFVRADAVEVVRAQIARASTEQHMSLIAYCFMPDHVHLLVEGQSDDSDCRRFIARAKQYSGFYYQASFGRRLWQRYGYEHVLRNEQAAVSIARYIVENPVRAGMAAAAQDYPFSGSSVYTLEQLLDAVQLRDRWYVRSGLKPSPTPVRSG
jgi:putative transposase